MISLCHAGKYLTLDIYVASPPPKKKKDMLQNSQSGIDVLKSRKK